MTPARDPWLYRACKRLGDALTRWAEHRITVRRQRRALPRGTPVKATVACVNCRLTLPCAVPPWYVHYYEPDYDSYRLTRNVVPLAQGTFSWPEGEGENIYLDAKDVERL